jgi:diguanylate cyclase (GGDEF)-like protein/PAS domain S-box-containing protein
MQKSTIFKFITSPITRLSFSIVMLTVSLLLLADLLGLTPDANESELETRKVIVESLAVQLSGNISNDQMDNIENTLHSVVARNDSVLSAAVRLASGDIFAAFGMHDKNWTLQADDSSTSTQVHVQLVNKQGLWGNVELRFKPLYTDSNFFQSPLVLIILFMSLAGFIVYLLFLKHSLKELNPDAVIPERVRAALDTLTEGLLIIDQDDYIVFTNTSFADKTGLPTNDLIGKKSSDLGWDKRERKSDSKKMPWMSLLEGEEMPSDVTVRLKAGLVEARVLTVNASPIISTGDKVRGVLITFNDITQIESKNEELNRAMVKIESSQREIKRQNKELEVLATRDPLTNALNRRSLFQGFDAMYIEAVDHNEELGCIMVDIDHFKAVNDIHGHAVGDTVIKFLATLLTEYSRPNDLVGRYGGEEFVIVLPATNIEESAVIAERMRQAIQAGDAENLPKELHITSSFGVSSLAGGASAPGELVEYADEALYVAKEGGRNRVVMWSDDLATANSENTEPVVKQEVTEASVGTQVQPTTVTEVKPKPVPSSSSNEPTVEKAVDSERLLDGEVIPPKKIETHDVVHGNSTDMVLLFDRIDQAIKRSHRYNTQTVVLVLNIDALQRIQDTMGMKVASKLTKTISARLKEAFRETDTISIAQENELLFSISRMGNNDIVILLADLEDTDIVTTIIQRIFTIQSEPVEVEGNELYLNTDIGVSVYPIDGDDMDTLIKKASSAMRAGKTVGKNNYRFYSSDINKHSRHQLRLEADLHHALERDEFIIHYQPKVDIKTGEIASMEALIRWGHPQLGMVNPNDFISLAEQTGMIHEIMVWVIREVSKQLNIWKSAGHEMIKVAVNLSPVQFHNPKLGDNINELFKELGVENNAIEIEITESALMQNMDTAIGSLGKLNEAGVHIALDDFGTGYSSLSCLKNFPLDTVKIDRSFIIDLVDSAEYAALVYAIIAMSKALNLKVVAEGVETVEQLRFLQDMGCDQIQGYLTAKPMPSNEILKLMSDSSSIKRMVTDHVSHQSVLPGQVAATSISGMMGILNEFTETALQGTINQPENKNNSSTISNRNQ